MPEQLEPTGGATPKVGVAESLSNRPVENPANIFSTLKLPEEGTADEGDIFSQLKAPEEQPLAPANIEQSTPQPVVKKTPQELFGRQEPQENTTIKPPVVDVSKTVQLEQDIVNRQFNQKTLPRKGEVSVSKNGAPIVHQDGELRLMKISQYPQDISLSPDVLGSVAKFDYFSGMKFLESGRIPVMSSMSEEDRGRYAEILSQDNMPAYKVVLPEYKAKSVDLPTLGKDMYQELKIDDIFSKVNEVDEILDRSLSQSQLELEELSKKMKEASTKDEFDKYELSWNDVASKSIYYNIWKSELSRKDKTEIYPEEVSSRIQNIRNEKKYEILKSAGYVNEVDKTLPDNIKSFLLSSEYLNSTAKEKMLYAKQLWMVNRDKYATPDELYKKISNTFTPAINLVYLKQKAKDLEAKAKQYADKLATSGEGFDTTNPIAALENLQRISVASKPLKLLQQIISADYENESSFFGKAWNAIVNNGGDAIPYLATALDIANSGELYRIVNKVKVSGKQSLNEDERLLYDVTGMFNTYTELSKPDGLTSALNAAPGLLSFIFELKITGGIPKFTEKVIRGGATAAFKKAVDKSPDILKGAYELLKGVDYVSGGSLKKLALNASRLGTYPSGILAQMVAARGQEAVNSAIGMVTDVPNMFVDQSDMKMVDELTPAHSDSFGKSLAQSGGLEAANIAAMDIAKVIGIGQNNIVGKLMDRFEKGSPQYNLLKLLRANELESQAVARGEETGIESFINRARHVSPASAVPDMLAFGVAMPPIESAILGEFEDYKDRMWSNPYKTLTEDVQAAAIGLAVPILGGKLIGINNLVRFENIIFRNKVKFNEFQSKVFSMPKEEFMSEESLLSLRKEADQFLGSKNLKKDELGKLMHGRINHRIRFEEGKIEGAKGATYEEYLENSVVSQTKMNELLDLIRDGKDSEGLIEDAILSSSDAATRRQFEFHRDLVNSYATSGKEGETMKEYVDKHKATYFDIKKEFAALDSLMTAPDWANYDKRISESMLPFDYREELRSVYDALKVEWDARMQRIYGTSEKASVESPEVMNVGTENSKHTFIRKSDGSYKFVSGDQQSAASDVSFALESMAVTDVLNVFRLTKNSDMDFSTKESVLNSIKERMLSEFQDTEMFDAFGGRNNMSDLVSALSEINSSSPLTEQQKTNLSNGVMNVIEVEARRDSSLKNYREVHSAIQSLIQNADIIDIKSVVDFNKKISGIVMRNAVKELTTEQLSDEVAASQEGTQREILAEEVRSRGNNEKMSKEDVSRLLERLSVSPVRTNVDFDTLRKANKSVGKVADATFELVKKGVLSEKELGIVEQILCSYNPKFIDLSRVVVKEGKSRTDASRYNDKSKTITIVYHKSQSKEELVAEIAEELNHHIEHNIASSISNGGTIGEWLLTDEMIQQISGTSRTDAIAQIAKWYKSKDYDYATFLDMKAKKPSEMTPEELREYTEIKDMLVRFGIKYGQKWDSLKFIDTENKLGWEFTTESLVRNWNRYNQMKGTVRFDGRKYTSAEAFYFSAYSHEYFARTVGDYQVAEISRRLEGSPEAESITQKTINFISKNVKLPSIMRMFRSEVFAENNKPVRDMMSGLDRKNLEDFVNTPGEAFNEAQKMDFDKILDAVNTDKETDALDLFRELVEDKSHPDRLNDYILSIADKAEALGYDASITNDIVAYLIKDAEIVGTKIFSFRDKEADEIRYVSNTMKALESLKIEKTSGANWMDKILSSGGKKVEIERYGLDEFLKTNKSPTKEEILDFLSDKVMKVKDIILGGSVNKETALLYSKIEENKNRIVESGTGDYYYDSIEPFTNPGVKLEEEYLFNAIDNAHKLNELEPFSDNKKFEILGYIKNIREAKEELMLKGGNSGFDKETRHSHYTTFPLNNYRELLPVIDTEKKLFSSESHFKGIKNQLYHNRLNDVVSASGKRLLLSEEMQADWTQSEIKNAGFFATEMNQYVSKRQIESILESKEKLLLLESENPERFEIELSDRGYDGGKEQLEKEIVQWKENLKIAKDDIKQKESPFTATSDWVRAAIKRMIKMAVAEGKDGIAWTPAHVQVERWTSRVRGVVDRIEFSEATTYSQKGGVTRKDGTILVEFYKNNQRPVNPKEYMLVNDEWTDYDGHSLAETVGSEIAKKIIAEKNGTIEGENIIVGGQGYIDIYDKTAVNVANKIAKKYGLEVGSEEVREKAPEEYIDEMNPEDFEKPIKVHSLLFNEQMRADIEKQNEIEIFSKRGEETGVPSAFGEYKNISDLLLENNRLEIEKEIGTYGSLKALEGLSKTDKNEYKRLLDLFTDAKENYTDKDKQSYYVANYLKDGWFREKLKGIETFKFKIDDSKLSFKQALSPGANPIVDRSFSGVMRFLNGNKDSISRKAAQADTDELLGKNIFLDDVISHSKLFNAYSEVRDINVEFYWDDSPEAIFGWHLKESGSPGTLALNVARISKADDPVRAFKETILHEVQHEIQVIEGFNRGINYDYIKKNIMLYNIYLARERGDVAVLEGLEKPESAQLKELINKVAEGKQITPQEYNPVSFWKAAKLNNSLFEILGKMKASKDFKAPYDMYRGTAGELESFDTEPGNNELPATLKASIGAEVVHDGYEKPIRPQDIILFRDNTMSTNREIGSKRTDPSPVDTAWFEALFKDKDAKISTDEIERLVKDIDDNIQNFITPERKKISEAKRAASEYAHNMIELWKGKFLSQELPKSSTYERKEILRLTKIPVRKNLSSYTKDIQYVQSIVENATFRKELQETNKEKSLALNRFMRHNKDNVPFYVASNRLAKIDTRMFDAMDELTAYRDLLMQKPETINVQEFISSVDKMNDKYLEWKKQFNDRFDVAPEQDESVSILEEQLFLEKKNLAKQIVRTQFVNNGLSQLDRESIDAFSRINVDQMNDLEFSEYEKALKYLLLNPTVADHKVIKLVDKYRAKAFYEKASNQLSQKYVDLINQRSLPSSGTLGTYLKGLTPIFGKDKLGNLAPYNIKSLFEIAESMASDAPGVLQQEITEPINESYQKFLAYKAQALREISAKGKYTIPEMHRIGIKMLLNQKPQFALSSKALSVLSEQGIDISDMAEGELLSSKSTGAKAEAYNYIREQANETIKESILLSFGIKPSEEWSDSAIEEALGDVSVMSRRSISQIKDELQQLLKDSGYDSLKQLVDDISSDAFTLSRGEREYIEKTKKTFDSIKNGEYSDGLGLKSASEQINGIEFQEIEDYFPLIRYKTYSTVERYLDPENNSDTPESAKIFYGIYNDFQMNTQFLEKRKPSVMALQTNAYEAVAKRIDEQLFYLNHARHQNYLKSVFRTPLFYDKGTAFNTEATNQFVELLNGYYNRGVNEERAVIRKDLEANTIYSAIQRYKALYVSDWLKSPAQLSTVVFAFSKMKGNPITKARDVAAATVDTSESYVEGSDANVFLSKYAPEVYFRGLTSYDFVGMESSDVFDTNEGGSTRLSEMKRNSGRVPGVISGLQRGIYKTNKSRGSVIAGEVFNSKSTFGSEFNLAGLKFFDRIAARASFFSIYKNRCEYLGVEYSLTNPNKEALNYALESVRETQNTDNPLYKSGLSYNISGGKQMAFPGDWTMMNLLAFKSYSINERQTLLKARERFRNAYTKGDKEAMAEAASHFAYSFASKMAFNYIKLVCQKYILATAASYLIGDDASAREELVQESIGTSTELSNVALHAALDYFVLAEPAKWAATLGVKYAENKWKGELTDEEKEKYAGSDMIDNGMVSGFVDDLVTSIGSSGMEAASSVDEYGVGDAEAQRDAARFMLLLSQVKYGFPGASITGDLLKEMNKQTKIQESGSGKQFTSPYK